MRRKKLRRESMPKRAIQVILNFTSLDDLRDQILAFIAYSNATMAKPIKWTYTGLI
jgi:hypothetical protein